MRWQLLIAIASSVVYTALTCFVGKALIKAPGVNTPPWVYNNLSNAATSPLQDDGTGLALGSCGHSKYWNAGETFTRLTHASGVVSGVAALPNEFPWQVSLSITQLSSQGPTILCGGVVINRFWVITAGHCFRNVNPGDASSYTGIVTYGEHDLTVYERSELFRDIDYVVRHPSYTDVIFDYDYALVRVTAPVSFKTWNIQPICLPESCSASCQDGDMAFVSGWGQLGANLPTSDVLMKAKLPVVSTVNCALSNLGIQPITSRMLCAGYATTSADVCFGDSGGPLAIAKNGYFELCGIASNGVGCASEDTYGVYSKVCVVRAWIRQISGT